MANDLLTSWGSMVLGVVLAVLLLLAMITIHEFGHFLAGKALGFRIDEFSIGFGPALFKKRRKKTGELFAVRLIPLGGYCAFHGEDGQEDEEEPLSTEEGKEAERPYGGDFTKMACWKRIVVLISGAAMNYLLALLLILIGFSAYGQSVVRMGRVATSPEEGYSFFEGDLLLGADGKDFYLTQDIARAVNGKEEGDVVTFTVARLTEGGERTVVQQPIRLRRAVHVKSSADFTGVWEAIGTGVETREDGKDYYAVASENYRLGFFATIGHSFVYSFRLAGSIFRVLGELLTGKLGLNALGGPVTTITMTSQIAAQGFRDFLEIAALIGVNLAVFNLLPIPALDGSKVVFTLIEWIFKKPVPRKVEAVIHAVGFLLLLGFAVLVDILQFV